MSPRTFCRAPDPRQLLHIFKSAEQAIARRFHSDYCVPAQAPPSDLYNAT